MLSQPQASNIPSWHQFGPGSAELVLGRRSEGVVPSGGGAFHQPQIFRR